MNSWKVVSWALDPTLAEVVAKKVAVFTRPVILIAAAFTSVELAVKLAPTEKLAEFMLVALTFVADIIFVLTVVELAKVDPTAIAVVLTTVVPIVKLTGLNVAVLVEFAIDTTDEFEVLFAVEFPMNTWLVVI